MNTLKNTVRLIGRLGQDPEVRNLEKGNKVARFTLATSDRFKGKDGQVRNETQWHNLVVWGSLAGICEKYLTKGKEIAVEGKLTYRNWEDNNSIKHYTTEIVVNEFTFIGSQAEEKSATPVK